MRQASPVEKKPWGKLDDYEEEEEEEEESEEEDEGEGDDDDETAGAETAGRKKKAATDEAGEDAGGLVTPSGFESTTTTATSTAGMETPDTIELRKDRRYVRAPLRKPSRAAAVLTQICCWVVRLAGGRRRPTPGLRRCTAFCPSRRCASDGGTRFARPGHTRTHPRALCL